MSLPAKPSSPIRSLAGQQLTNVAAFREALWEKAGISVEERADGLAKAFKKNVQMLEAKKTEIISYQGQVMDTIELNDNQAQLRASENIFDLTGVNVGKQESGGSGNVQVIVNLPGWSVPDPSIALDNGNNTQTLDVTPQDISDDNKSESLVREE